MPAFLFPATQVRLLPGTIRASPSGAHFFYFMNLPEMDLQDTINLIFGLASLFFTGVSVLGGWFLTTIRDAIRDLSSRESLLAEKVQHIEVLVAGKYYTREEAYEYHRKIDEKLDKIYEVLKSKADR